MEIRYHSFRVHSIFPRQVRGRHFPPALPAGRFSIFHSPFSIFFFFFFLFPFSLLHPQYSVHEFEHLSIEQGFFQSRVNCILQDQKGLLWFGTNDGLSRYDGYSFKTFRNIPSDPGSISENNITALTEDNDGNLWIGTASGFINIFNPALNKFGRYKLEYYPLFSPSKIPREKIPPCYADFSFNTITAIYSDRNEFIWIGTFGSGLFLYDPYTNSLVQYYYSDDGNTISSDYVLSIEEDNNGTIWIGTFTGGLNKIDFRADINTREILKLKFTSFKHKKDMRNSINDNRITSLEYYEGKLWIATFRGLNLLEINKEVNDSNFVDFLPASDKNSLNSNFLTKIDKDKNGNLWIGSFGRGLIKLNTSSGILTEYMNDPGDLNSIDNNEVVSLLADKNGLIWAGTFNGYGINKLNPDRKKFHHFKTDPGNKKSLSDNIITAFAEDSKGDIWIGTYKGGINKFSRAEKVFTSFKLPEQKNITAKNSYITSLLADENDHLWIGTYEAGLLIFDPLKNKINQYVFDKGNQSSISGDRITSIIKDKNGETWIGTSGQGLNKAKTDERGNLVFTRFQSSTLYPGTIPSDYITGLMKDRDHQLWVISEGGFISLYNYESGEFTSYSLDSSIANSGLENFSTLTEDPSGNFWIGTEGGLLLFSKPDKKFSNEKNLYPLVNKSIAGILCEDSILWISSNHGLTSYNTYNQTISNYNTSDGLQSLKFNKGASILTSKGEMYFGGINGFNSFFPGRIEHEERNKDVIITSFFVSNKEIPPSDGKIDLSSSDNSFSIHFTSTDYSDPIKNEYFHKLEGYDKEWIYIGGGSHIAEYKDIPPGRYIFKVKSAINTNPVAGASAKLLVTIPVVFWKSWWFILLIILMFGGIIFSILYYRIRQFLVVEKLKTKLSADLHDSVGSGLTEISLLCEIAQDEYKNELKKTNPNLTLISQKSRELVDNMSDIVWLVNPKVNSLHDLILRLKDIYSPVLNGLGINFKVDISDSIKDINIHVNKRQNIYLIFKEGINNCIKYSKAKNISLNLEPVDNSYRIILKDDGCGFEIEQAKGNGLRNMENRAKNIGAQFSIHSLPEKGTTVMLKWKKGLN